ncbi:MAG: heparinase II/III-family protein [Bacteroidetes bacterium]|nr:heparinase II/III-family protein [Bacteroidota bacterium]
MLRNITSLLILLILFTTNHSISQTGSWNPAGANLSFPRTLLKSAEISNVSASLTTPHIKYLFEGVYNVASSAIPTGNSTTSDRMARGHIAKNSAFTVLMEKKVSGGSVVDLPVTERNELITKAISILDNINTSVEAFGLTSDYEQWQWRTKEMIDLLSAYDLLKGAGVPDGLLTSAKSRLQTFAGNLYKEAAVKLVFGFTFFGYVKNNHALMAAAALGFAAVVLNDATSSDANYQPVNWINASIWNLDNVLWRDDERQSEPGVVAGYAEGPHYFRYAFLNCLPLIKALGNFLPDGSYSFSYRGNTRTIRNPFYDPNYNILYDWMVKIKMPDGRYPALEDSFINEAFPELALTGKTKYHWPLYIENISASNSLSEQLRSSSTDMRANYIAANLPFTQTNEKPFQALPEAGSLVFRSSWDSLATFMHILAEYGNAKSTGGHNHADVTSFIIHSHGQLLVLDPGYVKYGRRGEVGNATNHNMILVDGAGPPIGVPGNPNDADGFIENTFDTGMLDYGEARTNYLGTNIIRKALFIRDKYFILYDFINSTSAHNFTWQLHGYGLEGGTTEGEFVSNFIDHQGKWTKNGATLLAHVTAHGGASNYTTSVNKHEFTYDSTENHTVMLVHKNSVSSTHFLSVLFPYKVTSPTITTLSHSDFSILKTQSDNFTDVVAAKQDMSIKTIASSVTGLNKDLSTNALYSFFSVDNTNTVRQIFVDSSTVLRYGTDDLFTSSKRIDFTFQRIDSANHAGYASAASTVIILIDRAPSNLSVIILSLIHIILSKRS